VIQLAGKNASLYGNVSRLFEPPTNYQLQDNVVGGDATLAPMRGTVMEVGARGEMSLASARSLWDVSVYYAQIDDEILSVDDPAAPGVSLATNIDRTIHAGLEASFNARIPLDTAGRSIEPLVSVTVNDFTFDGDASYVDNDLPAAPEYFVRAELIYRAARGFHIGPTVDVVGERWADFANTYRIESYTLFGLRAGWTAERWHAYLELRNLTDESYAASHSVRNVARSDDRILNPGEPQSAYFGVQVRLN
jgi:iron complex outermembrane recepter protein